MRFKGRRIFLGTCQPHGCFGQNTFGFPKIRPISLLRSALQVMCVFSSNVFGLPGKSSTIFSRRFEQFQGKQGGFVWISWLSQTPNKCLSCHVGWCFSFLGVPPVAVLVYKKEGTKVTCSRPGYHFFLTKQTTFELGGLV